MTKIDTRWMRLALSLAKRGLGCVWPNPAVGCVLVKDGRLVGRGWTQPTGRPHAETMALAQAGDAARGATAYVTLEPCAHHGKTPPCAVALVRAGVDRVVCALEDPDPRVSGRGFKHLNDAGIDVQTGLLSDEAEALNLGFILNRTIERPMVTLKLATSLDGRIATDKGESRWITGPESRRQVHLMRAEHDAVLIGRGTAAADDPMLDVRGLGLAGNNPVRVVADGGLSISPISKLAMSAPDAPLWLCHRPGIVSERLRMWEDLGAKLIEVNTTETGELDTVHMMTRLAQNGLTRVLCEGGGHLAASLLADDLVDHLVMFTAGLVLGSKSQAGVGSLSHPVLSDFPRFKLDRMTRTGQDTMTCWTPRR